MNDTRYLNDSNWLAERDKKWEHHAKEWLSRKSPEEISLRKKYFFSGEVEGLLDDRFKLDVSLFDIINCSPFKQVDHTLTNIGKYWNWVVASPNTRDRYQEKSDINARFVKGFDAVFPLYDDNLDSSTCVELFHWLYGTRYDKNRTVQLPGVEQPIKVLFDVDALCWSLMLGITAYLWRPEERISSEIFRSLIPYFLSLYPHMSALCFSTALQDKDRYIGSDGKTYHKHWCYVNRKFVANLHGFISKSEEDSGIKELICRDNDALQEIKNGIANANMPADFYRFLEFIVKHKGKGHKLSEGKLPV